MKKLLMGFATCTLILTSCSTNEAFNNTSEGNLIGFNDLNDRLTKAANETNDNYGVYAKFSTGAAGYYTSFNNQLVNGINDTYTPMQPWPSTSKPLDFFAYAPHNAAGLTLPTVYNDGSISYSVPTDGQTDLTFAVATNQTSATPKVVLAFNHMLSCIKLGTIGLAQNLQDAGYTIDATATSTIRFYVQNTSGSNNLFQSAISDWTSVLGTGQMYSGKGQYYFMPQAIANATTVKIQLCGVKILKDGANYYEGDVKMVYVLPAEVTNTTRGNGASNGTFYRNSRYTVAFTIGSDAKKPGFDSNDPTVEGDPIFNNMISFSSTVTAWVDETMGLSLGSDIITPIGSAGSGFLAYITKIDTYAETLAAAAVINGSFRINGTIANAEVLDASGLSSTKFDTGSTVTIDAMDVLGLSATNTVTVTVPSGWTASGGKGASNNVLDAAGKITLTK